MLRTIGRILRNILFITAILLLLLGVMFLYVDYSAQIPFKLVLDVLIIQLVLFRLLAWRARILIELVNGGMIYNDEEAVLRLRLEKRSVYPYKYVECTVRYKSCYETQYHKKRIRWELGEKKTEQTRESLGLLKCGIYEIFIENVRLYDMFGFASAGLQRKMRQEDRHVCLAVLPTVTDIALEEGSYLQLTQDESEDYFGENEAGMQDQDVEVRPFAAGDKLNRIHWKLSAKAAELMVRDRHEEYDSMMYVLFELCRGSDLDEEFGKKASLCAKLLQNGYPVYMVWYEYSSRVGNYVRKRKFVNNIKKLEEGVLELMRCPLYNEAEREALGTGGAGFMLTT